MQTLDSQVLPWAVDADTWQAQILDAYQNEQVTRTNRSTEYLTCLSFTNYLMTSIHLAARRLIRASIDYIKLFMQGTLTWMIRLCDLI